MTTRTITNKFNLPDPMYRALSANTYTGGGDISATRLISPPRIVTLRKYHEHEIEEDASDRIWSLLGSSVHRMIELAASAESTVERRLFMPVAGIDTEEGPLVWKVSAQPDVYENKTLSDFKVTSIWSTLFGEKPEWVNQLNIQSCLHRYNGDEVNEAWIIAIMRDWQSSKARYEKDYPKCAVQRISVPLWSYEEQLDYITRRVKLHQTAEKKFLESNKDPNSLPMCSEHERWLRGETWAIKYQNEKTGVVNKRAFMKFNNKTDALGYMTDNKPSAKGRIWAEPEHRPGINMRCMQYCDVAKICPFGKQLHEEEEKRIMANLNNPNQPQGETEETSEE